MSNSNERKAGKPTSKTYHAFGLIESMSTRPQTIQFVKPTKSELAHIKEGKKPCVSSQHHTAEAVVENLLEEWGAATLMNPSMMLLKGCPIYDDALNPSYNQDNPKAAPKFLHDISLAKFAMFLQGDGKDLVQIGTYMGKPQFKWKRKATQNKVKPTRMGGLTI